ncbi:uncharacterized protein LAESUDRAFT_742921 [Laetiporus sulphureus 93-53]|uniref:Uncharacterized protein n=1 Tax=Laetiporus sulphureus 93-53 TaxID=1314785 RepID=A0A165EPJ4_9APHY|nr:uncharacterized protein LAESUDRAFT_742921 [Laetiporus sulphureus 93-53]KZT07497.1 hypothetical protein LAESUDRAFT_742921 [Laetiporus sulphureus 93-53]
MGSAQSYFSGAAITTLLIAGAAAVVYVYVQYTPPSDSQPRPPPPPPTQGKKKKKKKQAETQSEVASESTTVAPNVVSFPPVIPGDFDTHSEPHDVEPARPSSKPKKKNKNKKASASGTAASRAASADVMSDSSATAPESQASVRPTVKSRKSSTPKPAPVDNDESWTRVDSRRRHVSQLASASISAPPAEAGTSDAGITTTSLTETSSPTVERSDDGVLPEHPGQPSENRRALAERLLPKPRKTGVDDMLETPDYPTLSRVMRIQPGPNDKPAAGFSWGDYEDVDHPRGTADDADREDDGGWGVVKGRGHSKTQKSATVPAAPETLTKKQRQNASKREAQKEAKAAAEADRQARLAKHERELERAKIAEQYAKKGKTISGGMTAYVDENGKLVWK